MVDIYTAAAVRFVRQPRTGRRLSSFAATFLAHYLSLHLSDFAHRHQHPPHANMESVIQNFIMEWVLVLSGVHCPR